MVTTGPLMAAALCSAAPVWLSTAAPPASAKSAAVAPAEMVKAVFCFIMSFLSICSTCPACLAAVFVFDLA
jgi:hypothetical protein